MLVCVCAGTYVPMCSLCMWDLSPYYFISSHLRRSEDSCMNRVCFLNLEEPVWGWYWHSLPPTWKDEIQLVLLKLWKRLISSSWPHSSSPFLYLSWSYSYTTAVLLKKYQHKDVIRCQPGQEKTIRNNPYSLFLFCSHPGNHMLKSLVPQDGKNLGHQLTSQRTPPWAPLGITYLRNKLYWIKPLTCGKTIDNCHHHFNYEN